MVTKTLDLSQGRGEDLEEFRPPGLEPSLVPNRKLLDGFKW